MVTLLGTKLGMTRVFDSQGKVVPVTALRIDPCVVTQIKSDEKDGYTAIQVGSGKARHPKKPQVGHTKSLDATPQVLREFRVEDKGELEVGQVLDCTGIEIDSQLKLVGVSKGKGFAGVIKRHNFHRGPATHGSDHHRAPGSIGAMYPQHVMKGEKMPGHMGVDQITLRKVKVIDVLPEQNLVLVKGPVPGSPGSLVEISSM